MAMHIRAKAWCLHLLLAGFLGLGQTFDDTGCAAGSDASLGGSLLQVHRQQASVVEKAAGWKDRFDTSCFYDGNDKASRDSSCTGDLVCAKRGFDDRHFGDCPAHHCCSLQTNVKEQFDTTCWDAGTDTASRDASCKGDFVCARNGFDDRSFGDCATHCCSAQIGVKDRFDNSCWSAGSDMYSRDESCKEGLVCAQKGHDNRDFGDCPGKHCCSTLTDVLERYDTSCWHTGADVASRDAACKGDLMCARRGFDNRNFGDCGEHCCSKQLGVLERLDTSCWSAGSDMATRDASCKEGLSCAQQGYDSREFGDCPGEHCCSMVVRDRYDTTCWDAGSDMTSRDASCKGILLCARKGFDNRDFGDCATHCCSAQTGVIERFGECWRAGSDTASRDAACKEGLLCARNGDDDRNFGDCPGKHCCSTQTNALERYDTTCYHSGSDTASRDAACKGDLVCSRKGFDNRDFGDCGEHCCSTQLGVKEHLDITCWQAGSDMASRDASCREGFVCAKKGHDNRNFGDCPKNHCCSKKAALNAFARLDTSCWSAGQDTASRDASCQEGLVCALRGYDNREFGDCPGHHCCSTQTKERLDKTCWSAGSDMASRDASCRGDLICARPGYDGRQYGECPKTHCCSVKSAQPVAPPPPASRRVAGQAVYGVGADGKIYKQLLSSMSSSTEWKLTGNLGKPPMKSICIKGGTIYGVGSDNKVHRQALNTMSPTSDWTSVAAGDVQSIALHGDTIYGVGTNKQVYKQVLSKMASESPWLFAGEGLVTSIAISGGVVYGTGTDGRVYKQNLSTLSAGAWSLAGNARVTSIAIDGDTIYGTSGNQGLYKQVLSAMTPTTPWLQVANGNLVSVAITSQADPGRI